MERGDFTSAAMELIRGMPYSSKKKKVEQVYDAFWSIDNDKVKNNSLEHEINIYSPAYEFMFLNKEQSYITMQELLNSGFFASAYEVAYCDPFNKRQLLRIVALTQAQKSIIPEDFRSAAWAAGNIKPPPKTVETLADIGQFELMRAKFCCGVSLWNHQLNALLTLEAATNLAVNNFDDCWESLPRIARLQHIAQDHAAARRTILKTMQGLPKAVFN